MSFLSDMMRNGITDSMRDAWHNMISDNYTRSIFAMYPIIQKVGIRPMVEALLRATDGEALDRPLGSPVVLSPWEKLLLNPVHLYRMPVSEKDTIDTSVTIGPAAGRPLKLAVPIMIAGMSWGGALSMNIKTALAKAASLTGTATNTGEAPLMKAEREAAGLLIGQYSRSGYIKEPEDLKQLDAIEIQLGQGAQVSAPVFQPSRFIGEDIRKATGSPEGKPGKIPTRLKGVNSPEEFKKLVADLKKYEVPVGVKFAATDYIERELDIITNAGVDFIVVDGAEAGTHAGPTILQDDMGLPTLHALARAYNYLDDIGAKDRVSIIAAGGLTTPGHILKAMALGADAVYIGTIALISLLHTQMTKALPFEPATQMALYTGVFKDELDVDKGAENLANYIHSCVKEMEMACYAMGRPAVRDVDRSDLCCIDRDLAALCRIRWVYRDAFEPAEHDIAADLLIEHDYGNRVEPEALQ